MTLTKGCNGWQPKNFNTCFSLSMRMCHGPCPYKVTARRTHVKGNHRKASSTLPSATRSGQTPRDAPSGLNSWAFTINIHWRPEWIDGSHDEQPHVNRVSIRVWPESWSTSPTFYNLGSSKYNYLKLDTMKYIQWFLAYNLSRRANSSATLNKWETSSIKARTITMPMLIIIEQAVTVPRKKKRNSPRPTPVVTQATVTMTLYAHNHNNYKARHNPLYSLIYFLVLSF